jgi:predicted alpha/beta superfamily hydrolase
VSILDEISFYLTVSPSISWGNSFIFAKATAYRKGAFVASSVATVLCEWLERRRKAKGQHDPELAGDLTQPAANASFIV